MLGTFRVRTSSPSSGECDDSDEECAPSAKKGVKLNEESGEMKVMGSKAGQMWADFINEQSLLKKFSGQVAVDQAEISIARDVESYDLSNKQLEEKQAQFTAKPNYRLKSIKNSKYKLRKMEKKVVQHTSLSHKANGAENGQKSLKRNRQMAFARKIPNYRRNHLKKIIDKNYSMEALLNAEFPHGLPIDELAKRICVALGEKDPQFITSVIMILAEDKALELFNMTREIEAAGGMKVADGSRRRTPGGVFMTLFKTDTDIPIKVKEHVAKLQKQNVRKLRKTKRRLERSKVNSGKSSPTPGNSSLTTGKFSPMAEESSLMSE